MIQVAIAENHEAFVEGVRAMLAQEPDMELVLAAQNGQELLQQKLEGIDVLLLDLNMPVMDGLETARILATQTPAVKIMILTVSDEMAEVSLLLEIGVIGYMLKDSFTRQNAPEVIRRLFEGERYLDATIRERLEGLYMEPKPARPFKPVQLNGIQFQVLNGIAAEKTTQEIALYVKRSPSSVKRIRNELFGLFGVKNAAGLVRAAIANGVLGSHL
ncbi:MAG: response regulator [Salibacteraceae bacterium]